MESAFLSACQSGFSLIHTPWCNGMQISAYAFLTFAVLETENNSIVLRNMKQ